MSPNVSPETVTFTGVNRTVTIVNTLQDNAPVTTLEMCDTDFETNGKLHVFDSKGVYQKTVDSVNRQILAREEHNATRLFTNTMVNFLMNDVHADVRSKLPDTAKATINAISKEMKLKRYID